MAEYIEREATIASIENVLRSRTDEKGSLGYLAFSVFVGLLKIAPASDVVKVVRCKDCVFSRELDEYEKKLYLDNCVGCCFHSKSYYSLIMEDKDFCSCGQKKEGAEE